MTDKRRFGELESIVLQEIKLKKKATVKDIYLLLQDSIAYTTIMTVMNRLFEKRILQREKISRSYVYWLRDSNYFTKVLDKIKKRFFSGNSIEMISYLLQDNNKITKKELNQIDELIQKIKKEKNK